MTRLHSHNELTDFASGGYPREAFGPESDNPYFAFDLGGHAGCGDWLRDLPCPVIGIGTGPLERYCDVVLAADNKLGTLARNIEKSPMAAMVLVQHLRASEILSITDALTAESFAYAALQTGPEFQEWNRRYKGSRILETSSSPLDITINKTRLSLTMTDPPTHNAIGTVMRDALCEALDLALIDETYTDIHISGSGRTFSTGGAVEEFGVAPDPATAHWVRSLRLPAWRLARLKNKLGIHVNGAAIGAGAEITAFGKNVTASPKAWFQLPELKYGLIPGAGGTASLPRRIGRQRTAYMALSMEKITAKTALEWGLVDSLID